MYVASHKNVDQKHISEIFTDDTNHLFSGAFNRKRNVSLTLTKVLLLPKPKHRLESGFLTVVPGVRILYSLHPPSTLTTFLWSFSQ